jgi:hypothetical protein
MDIRELFGIKNYRINWKYPISLGLALITPALFLTIFILIVGRLILGVNSGIFSTGLLYLSLFDFIGYCLLILSLTILLRLNKIPILISAIIAAGLSRIVDIIIGSQFDFIFLNIMTNFLLIVLIQTFILRFKNNNTGLVLAFLIATLFNRLLENVLYGFHVYKSFGIEAIINNFQNGEMIKKLAIDLTSGILTTTLFILGLLISKRLFKKGKDEAL